MARGSRSALVIAWLLACNQPLATEAREGASVDATPTQPVPVSVSPSPTHQLQRWMESELLYRIRTQDFRGLVRSLDALAAVAPPGFPHWAEIAARASQAAKDHDVEAVRRGCATCHQQYRARYRTAAVECDIDRLTERSRP